MAGKDSEVMVRTKSGALCLRDCIKSTSIHQSAALHLSFRLCVCVCVLVLMSKNVEHRFITGIDYLTARHLTPVHTQTQTYTHKHTHQSPESTQ